MLPTALSRIAGPIVIPAVLLFAAVLVAGLTVRTVNGMVDDARVQSIAERDAHWSAEIDAANAAAALQVAEQVRAALAVEAAANNRVREVENKLTELENENAALPNGDACGIDRDRVRLLNR